MTRDIYIYIYIYERDLQTHRQYTIVALHPRVFQVSLFIFLPQGRTGNWNILITYMFDGEVNHNQTSTHNRGKSIDKYDK